MRALARVFSKAADHSARPPVRGVRTTSPKGANADASISVVATANGPQFHPSSHRQLDSSCAGCGAKLRIARSVVEIDACHIGAAGRHVRHFIALDAAFEGEFELHAARI